MKITNLSSNSQELRTQVLEFLTEWNNDKSYILANTSGSTGAPKQIKIDKKKMENSARMTGKFFHFQKGQTSLLVLSPKYIAGKMMVVRALIHEMDLLIGTLGLVPFQKLDSKVDFCAMIPSQIQELLAQNISFDFIKNIIIGGAPVGEKLHQQIKSSVKSNCFATYGMTETLSHIALADLKKESLVYECLPDIKIKTDEEDALLIDAPKLTDATLRTNDIVSLLGEKRFVWKGRKDFVINSGGIKLHAEEIEKKLSKEINVPFFIFAIEDDKFGQRPALAIESEEKENIENILAQLTKIERPERIVWIDKFEYTPNGKINRIKTIEKCS